MTRRGSKAASRANRAEGSEAGSRADVRPTSRPSRSATEPEEAARAALAHEALPAPSGDKVKLTLRVSLSREQAERLTARAIREGKNLVALVAEILEAAVDDRGVLS